MVKVIEVLGVTLLFGLLSGCGIISEATYEPLVPLKLKVVKLIKVKKNN